MTNDLTRWIGFLLLPAAIFVLSFPIQAEAKDQFKLETGLVTPLDLPHDALHFEKGTIKFTVNGDAFKARLKFNKIEGTHLDDAMTMSLILDCRVSRASNGSVIVHEFPVTVDIPLDTAINGKNLRYKEKGSLLELPLLVSPPLPADIEDGDMFEVLSVRIDLTYADDDDMMMTSTVAVPGFMADLSEEADNDDS